MINRRSYLEKLEMYTNQNLVKIITGVRRCGKTTLMKAFIEELKLSGIEDNDIIYINFESVSYSYYKSNGEENLRSTLNDFIKKANRHAYIFLDEVEEITGWARVSSEMMNLFDVDIYVSSSNSSIFKNDMGKTLDFRFVRIDVFPLSFSEYLDIVTYETPSLDTGNTVKVAGNAESGAGNAGNAGNNAKNSGNRKVNAGNRTGIAVKAAGIASEQPVSVAKTTGITSEKPENAAKGTGNTGEAIDKISAFTENISNTPDGLKNGGYQGNANFSVKDDENNESQSDPQAENNSLRDHFLDYLERGAMPGVYALEDEQNSRDYLNAIYNTIILKDVVQCNNLREIGHIDKIMEYVMSHLGETYSPKAIKDYCVKKGAVISVDTIYVCLEALSGAFLLNKVPRYDIKAERKLETQEKYYLCDPAFILACMPEANPPLKAQLENVLCNELLSRGFSLCVGKSGRSIVDFMGVRGEDRTYLNVCETISGKENERKAFNPLIRIRDNYFKMVLSLDPETTINKGGIINYPLIRFLASQ